MRFEPTTLEYIAFDSNGKEIADGYFEDVYQEQHRKDNLKLVLSECKNIVDKIKYIYMSVNDEQTSINYLEILKT